MIKIENLTHKYPNRDEIALDDLNLEINKGERVILIGSSGSGKSTLIKCINKLVEPVSGSVFVNGEEITKSSNKKTEIIRRDIGFIFQEFNLIESDTAFKNVLNGRLGYIGNIRTLFNRFRDVDYKICEDSMQRVGLLDLKDERVCNLSGGQKQRVSIARALSQEPQIILADEPVSSLDPKLMREIMDLLVQICTEKNITLITSLHFLELVKKYATRVIGIRTGKIVFDNELKEMNDKDLVDIYGETKDWYLYGRLGF